MLSCSRCCPGFTVHDEMFPSRCVPRLLGRGEFVETAILDFVAC